MIVLGIKSEDHQSYLEGDINVMVIHSMAVKTFHQRPKISISNGDAWESNGITNVSSSSRDHEC